MHHLTRLSLTYPKTTILLLTVITVGFAAGLPRVRTEFGFRVLLGSEHPSVQRLEKFIQRFGGGLPIQIAWSCGTGSPCRTAFDASSLELGDSIASALRTLPGIRRVEGLPNAPILIPDSDGFSIQRFVENGKINSNVPLLASRVLDDPLWNRNFVSKDGRLGVLVVQPIDIRNETDVEVVEAIQDAIKPFQERQFDIHLVGNAVSAVVAGRELAASMGGLVPFTVIAIASILLASSRSWPFTLAALATMGVALLWTFGLLGWMNWPRDAILEILAPLIMVIGVCDSIHFLSRSTSTGAPKSNSFLALSYSAREVGPPCILTTLTTAAAFASFATSALQTFVRFGLIAAFGAISCLFLTFSLLPLLLRSIDVASVANSNVAKHWDSALRSILRVGRRRSTSILSSCALLCVFCAVGWYRYLEVDTYWYELIGEQSRSVQSIRFLEEHLRPSATLEMEITLPPGVRVEDPHTLAVLAEVSRFLPTIDGLGETTSILNFIGILNQILHEDDREFNRFGDSTRSNAELIELVEFEDPDLVANWMDLGRSRLRISAEAAEQSNRNREEILATVRQFVASHIPTNWKIDLSGGLAINFDWVKDVQTTQMRSFPVAFALVFIMASLFLRSAALGLLSMIPTVVPVVAVLGIMGWVGMSLDVGRAMIAAILIGISVDDSIHVLTDYRRNRQAGQEAESAIEQAILRTGRAVVTTSVALALGFLTLIASAWQTISSFGFFACLAVIGALLATIFVIPALIYHTSTKLRI